MTERESSSQRRRSRGESGINEGLEYASCPHKNCGHFQELVIGDGNLTGGIVFDKDADVELNADIAYQTAKNQCGKCGKFIEEEDRRRVIRLGV